MTQAQVITAIAHERQIELFAEWGHRWLDSKRTGQVDAVMTMVTPLKNGGSTWQSYKQLFPIPLTELQNDYSIDELHFLNYFNSYPAFINIYLYFLKWMWHEKVDNDFVYRVFIY